MYTTRCVSRGKIRGAIYLDIGAGPEGTTGQEANKEERIHFDSREDWTRWWRGQHTKKVQGPTPHLQIASPPRVLSLPTSGRAALKADGPCATPPIVQNAAEKVKPSFWQSRPDKENNMLKESIQHPLSDLSANLSFLHDRSPPLEEKKKTEIPIYKYSPFSPVDSRSYATWTGRENETTSTGQLAETVLLLL